MLFDFIKSLYYEFLSYFVPQKQKYRISGKCIKCGNCCRQIRSPGMRNQNDLKLMQLLLPWYKRFYISGKDNDGSLILSCKYLNQEGTCSVYTFRPFLCRNYPEKFIRFNGEMPDGCGFSVEKKNFKDFLNLFLL